MARRTGATLDIDSLAQFDRLIRAGARRMAGWRLETVDLTGRTAELLSLDPAGALLLGCALTDEAEKHLRTGSALIFPTIPDVPFEPYRAELYSPRELYAGLAQRGYAGTPDARVYAWSRQAAPGSEFTIARALHDHAIDKALDERLRGHRTVGVMGGHRLPRDSAGYAAAARLGRQLAAEGRLVATGGGPGAMEAANLGAYLSREPNGTLVAALAELGTAPRFRPSTSSWARAAFGVLDRWPGGADSIGIPTWYYGHEPPNVFATGIAKYFQNSLREDTLLRHCDAGIVFLPGAAGTVQEIFMDACENYYAEGGAVTPMILVGKRHWTQEWPAWPLLKTMAHDRPMAGAVHLVDSIADVPALLDGRG